MIQTDYEEFAYHWKNALRVCNQVTDCESTNYAFASLIEYDLGLIKKALNQCVKDTSNPYPPTVKDVINIIENGNADAEKLAEESYLKVIEAIQRVGYMDGVDFGEKLPVYVIERLGGWTSLCSRIGTSLSQHEFHKRFTDEYKRMFRYKDNLSCSTYVMGASDDVMREVNGQMITVNRPKITNKVTTGAITTSEAKELLASIGIVF